MADADVDAREQSYKDGWKWSGIDCPFCPHADRSGFLILSGSGALTYTCSHANSCEYSSTKKPAGDRTPDFLRAHDLSEGWAGVRPGRGTSDRLSDRWPDPNSLFDAPAAERIEAEAEAADRNERAEAERPTIIVNAMQLDAKVAAAADAIARLNSADQSPRYFQHETELVRINADSGQTSTLGFGGMLDLLSQAATWLRATAKGHTQPADPPEAVVRVLQSRESLPGVPTLLAVAGTPTFAPDGRLLTAPGFDAETETYLTPEVAAFPPVPESPTAEQVAEARSLILDELLTGFPFASPADRANAVALLLLPFVRGFIRGQTPLHCIDAPAEGTGKSRLADVCDRVATGRPIQAKPLPTQEDECRKVLWSLLKTLAPFVSFDNVDAAVDSAALMHVVSEHCFGDRELGRSEAGSVPVRCVWLATRNYVTGSRDMVRRLVKIPSGSGMERPFDRPASSFTHALPRWADDSRRDLVVACLTLVRAWLAAGRPKGGQTKGGYEDWSATMGGLLVVAGVDGFLANAEQTIDDVSGNAGDWAAFVTAWASMPCSGTAAPPRNWSRPSHRTAALSPSSAMPGARSARWA